MITIIAFLVTILGSVNWLMIGLLQYDFIAGIFGYQSSIFSRIIYIVFGTASIILVVKLFKGKGTIAVFSRRNKKDLQKNLNKIGAKKKVETSNEDFSNLREEDFPQKEKYNQYQASEPFEEEKSNLFDEPFDD